jgi:hypothetical protein
MHPSTRNLVVKKDRGKAELASLARHDHVGIVAPTTGTDQPLMPIENRHLWAVPPRHFGRVRLYLMAARLAPYDEPHVSSRRTPERHRWAGFGFHLSPWSPVEAIRASTNERSNWFGRFTMLRLSLLTKGPTHGELARAHCRVSSA